MKRLKVQGSRLTAMVAALVVATLCMYFAEKCSHPAAQGITPEYPAKSGGDTLDVAIQISPLGYSLAGDTVSGLDYELLTLLGRRYGRAIKFHPFAPLDYALRGLDKGVFDIVVADLAATSSLRDSLALTRSVYHDREVLVQLRDDSTRITSPEQLAGDTVWLAAGSPFADRLRHLGEELGDTIVVVQNHDYTPEHLMMMVDAGRVRRAVVNQGAARRMAARYPRLDISTPVSFTQLQVWALSKRNAALRDTLDRWLETASSTPDYDALLAKYGLTN